MLTIHSFIFGIFIPNHETLKGSNLKGKAIDGEVC